eukprot:m.161317 g.161317  ORF g.161317 m.161317 type:complete len:213 (+) comp14572_c0_seq2:838-1476(+)
MRILQEEDSQVLALVVSPQSWCSERCGLTNTVYFGTNSGMLAAWAHCDESDRAVWASAGHEGAIWGLALARDGSKVFSGSEDGTVRVWSARDGAHFETLEVHTGSVYALAMAPNGTLYVGGEEGRIEAWSSLDMSFVCFLEGDPAQGASVWAPAVGLDGNVYSGSDDGSIKVWNSRCCKHVLAGHIANVKALALSADGRLISGSSDNTVRIW